MEDLSLSVPIVVDLGSGFCKAGFGGEDTPRLVIPTVVSPQNEHKTEKASTPSTPMRTPVATPSMSTFEEPNMSYLFGTDAFNETDKYSSLTFPVRNGLVQNFELIEQYYNYIFCHYKMDVSPEKQAVLISEANETPKQHRLKMAEIMFEKFKVPYLHFGRQAALDMFSAGKTTGLVIDMGHTLTQTVPVFEGLCLNHATFTADIGGEILTMYTKDLLKTIISGKASVKSRTLRRENTATILAMNKNLLGRQQSVNNLKGATTFAFESIGGYRLLQDMKERVCKVSIDYEDDIRRDNISQDYVLPDRTVIHFRANEVYTVPEALFNPSIIGKTSQGVHQIVINSFQKCDDYVRKVISQNVLLAGGGSQFEGMKQRLQLELNKLVQKTINEDILQGLTPITSMKVEDPSERKLSCWIGGSLLASLETFKDMSIHKSAYDDQGKHVVFKYCI